MLAIIVWTTPLVAEADSIASCLVPCHSGIGIAPDVAADYDSPDGGHRLRRDPEIVADASGATYAQGARMPCSECHVSHGESTSSIFGFSEARTGGPITAVRQLCEGCHRPSGSSSTTPTVCGLELRRLSAGVSAHADADSTPCTDCHGASGHAPEGHGGGGVDCAACHGTDGSHALHTNAADPRGPGGLACGDCHDTDSYPSFSSGTDTDLSGSIELGETDVCDTCHSPGGDYDGVTSRPAPLGPSSIGAKNVWDAGAYETTTTLRAGNERWCAGCHDDAPGNSQADGGGVPAPNVIGNENGDYPYGTGWGYYETGHGADDPIPSSTRAGPDMDCLGCHDTSLAHVDHATRTYSAPAGNYATAYRLADVGGNPPSSTGFTLCTPCHTYAEEEYGEQWVRGTQANFWHPGMGNMHWFHLRLTSDYWNSDWSEDGSYDSVMGCTMCHNAHGSSEPAMIRDGTLLSTPGTTDRVPFYDFSYQPDPPSSTTLRDSTGGLMGTASVYRADTSFACNFTCHSNAYTRPEPTLLASPVPYVTSGVAQSFAVGDPVTPANEITIIDANPTPLIKAATDLRIHIPASVDMTWDTGDGTADVQVSGTGSVSSSVSYEDGGKTLVIDVTADFAANTRLTVGGVGFSSFGSASGPDRLWLEVGNDGLPTVEDDRTKTIAATVDDLIVLDWELDERSGAVADDSSAYGHAGSIVGATWSDGVFDGALDFDGVDDRVRTASSEALTLRNAASLEVWVRVDALPGSEALLAGRSGTGTDRSYALLLTPAGELKLSSYDGAWNELSTSGLDLIEGVWHHVVGVFDALRDERSIYVDGVEQASSGAVIGLLPDHDDPFHAGSLFGDGVLSGTIDRVRVYDHPLDASEVAARFADSLSCAVALDASGSGAGIQSGDQVVITFSHATNGPAIDAASIDTVLRLSSSHSWKDGAGAIGSATWSTTTLANDTLTISLSTGTSAPSVSPGDTVWIEGGVTDGSDPIWDSAVIGGDFGGGVPSNAVGHWKLDEGGGTTAYDATTNGNHGTIAGGPATSLGRFGGARVFDGTDDRIEVSSAPVLNPAAALSVEAWIRAPDQTDASIASKYDSDPGNWDLYVDSAGDLRFRVWPAGAAATSPGSDLGAHVGAWTHVVGTFDGSTVRLFVDGIEAGSGTAASGTTANDAAALMTVGRRAHTTSPGWFTGRIDDVVVYDTALSPAAIRERAGARATSALASDASGEGEGVHAGDVVVLAFNGPTSGTALGAAEIDAALALPDGHTWLDGTGGIGGAVWSTNVFANDTLTVTLSDAGGPPTLLASDMIAFGDVLEDAAGRPLSGTIALSGHFGMIPGIVGYWHLDEGSGVSVRDASPNANDGVLVNGDPATQWVTGRFGSAIRFEPNDVTYLRIPDDPTLDLTSQGTVEVWAKRLADDGAFKRLLDKSGTYGAGYSLTSITNGGPGEAMLRWGNITPGQWLKSDSTVPRDEWTHIVGTYDGSTTRLYVDGRLDSQRSHATNAVATTDDLLIGVDQYLDASGTYDGVIDEVAVYDRAISDSEVLKRYGSWPVHLRAYDTSGGGAGIQAGDTVVLRFDGPTNGPVIDASNIDDALVIGGAGSWLDGLGGLGSATWSTDTTTNDTLTIALTTSGGAPDAQVRDAVTLGGVIRDASVRPIEDSLPLTGDFGAVAPDGAVAFWRFEEGTGTTALDSAGVNDGGIYTPSWVTGKHGLAIDLDGSQSYVTMGEREALKLERFSIETWVRPAALAWPRGIATYRSDDGDHAFSLEYYQQSVRFGMEDAAGDWDWVVHTDPISGGDWHHVVATSDGTTLTVYVDSTPASATITLSVPLYDSPGSFEIGRSMAPLFFEGAVDEFVVYDYCLDQAAVSSRYSATAGAMKVGPIVASLPTPAEETTHTGPPVPPELDQGLQETGPASGFLLVGSTDPLAQNARANTVFGAAPKGISTDGGTTSGEGSPLGLPEPTLPAAALGFASMLALAWKAFARGF